jgi:hypothetical protein
VRACKQNVHDEGFWENKFITFIKGGNKMLKKTMMIMFIVAISQIWIVAAPAFAGVVTANGWY